MTIADYEAAFEKRLDQCWFSVYVADVLQLNRALSWKNVSRDVRAGAAVMAMAEFEALISNCVELVHESVESSGCQVGDLRHGLRMLHYRHRFAATTGSSMDSVWDARIELSRSHESSDRPALPRRDGRGYLEPVGSKTPRANTLNRIWQVYGLVGEPIPDLRWRSSLGEMAEIRNDVAHARLPISEAFNGRTRSADAVASHIANLRDLGIYFAETLISYTSAQSYLS